MFIHVALFSAVNRSQRLKTWSDEGFLPQTAQEAWKA